MPQSLDQRLPDSVTSVSPGATVGQTSILLRAVLTDPDLGDSLHLEGEVRPVTVGFTGPNVPNGPAVANGHTAWLSVAGLSDKTSYHWRVRAGDNTGRSGAWASPGAIPISSSTCRTRRARRRRWGRHGVTAPAFSPAP